MPHTCLALYAKATKPWSGTSGLSVWPKRPLTQRARAWQGSLYNNLGWTYHGLERHDDALRMFEHSLQFETERKNEKYIAIAKWSIAKMYRYLGRTEEALQIQQTLLAHPKQQDNAAEGYTQEEIAECMLLLQHHEDAIPYFARAWQLLHSDPWLQKQEPERLERLKRLGCIP